MGRGKKRDDELTVFQFRLPPDLKNELTQYAKSSGRSMAEIAIKAIVTELSRMGNQKIIDAMNDPDDPFGQILRREIGTNPDIWRIEEKVLLEQAQKEKNKTDNYSFTLHGPAREGFERLTKDFDYPSPSYLAEELARGAVNHPDKARGILFGSVDRIIQEAQQSAKESKKKQKTA